MANANPSSAERRPSGKKITVNKDGKVVVPREYVCPKGVTPDMIEFDWDTKQFCAVKELPSGGSMKIFIAEAVDAKP